jgi:hypothetical protein
VDVYAVQEGTRDALLVAGDGGGGAGAGLKRVAVVAAGAGVQDNIMAGWRFPGIGYNFENIRIVYILVDSYIE